MTLNGWQRLWVVLTAIWLCVVATGVWLLRPSDPDWFATNAKWTFQILDPDGARRILFETDSSQPPTVSEVEQVLLQSENPTKADGPEIAIVGEDGKEHVFPAGTDPKRAAAIVRYASSALITANTPAGSFEYAVGTPHEELQGRYREKLLTARDASNRRLLLQAAGVWALPSIALYVAGLGVAWIRRGFQQGSPRKDAGNAR
jgi:hypothetical protein